MILRTQFLDPFYFLYPPKILIISPDRKIQLGLKQIFVANIQLWQIFVFGNIRIQLLVFECSFQSKCNDTIVSLPSHRYVQHVRNDFTMLDHA